MSTHIRSSDIIPHIVRHPVCIGMNRLTITDKVLEMNWLSRSSSWTGYSLWWQPCAPSNEGLLSCPVGGSLALLRFGMKRGSGRATWQASEQWQCVTFQSVVMDYLCLSVRVQRTGNPIGTPQFSLRAQHSQDPVWSLPVGSQFHTVLCGIMKPQQFCTAYGEWRTAPS